MEMKRRPISSSTPPFRPTVYHIVLLHRLSLWLRNEEKSALTGDISFG
jgi:hypothetical protein